MKVNVFASMMIESLPSYLNSRTNSFEEGGDVAENPPFSSARVVRFVAQSSPTCLALSIALKHAPLCLILLFYIVVSSAACLL